MIRLWKKEHLNALKDMAIPKEVLEETEVTLDVLNRFYGADRNVDAELGGFLALFHEKNDKKEYEKLLAQYHLESTDLELVETVHRDSDAIWLKELFLCSSDYSLVVMRPVGLGRLSSGGTERFDEEDRPTEPISARFDKTKPRYITKGIATELPRKIIMTLWRCIDISAEKESLDYLQVFDIETIGGTLPVLKVVHIQEEPEFKKVYYFPMSEFGWKMERRKLFAIDDETHQTLLFAEEY